MSPASVAEGLSLVCDVGDSFGTGRLPWHSSKSRMEEKGGSCPTLFPVSPCTPLSFINQ